MKIYNSLTELIGNTPMLLLKNYISTKNLNASIIAKLESFNPMSSVKDRAAFEMINDAENKNLIDKDTTIIEPTSGNTGIGLAFICASKGYKLILTMPETMSNERKQLLKALGAELVLTNGSDGMPGAIKKANEIKGQINNSFMPNQFENINNVNAHIKYTSKEILEDTKGKIDIFVACVGTGGTIIGVASVLKEYNKKIKVIAVEPRSSAVLSGNPAGSHKIQGIGAGFIPKLYDSKLVDDIITIDDNDAFKASRDIAKSDGILMGMSSGAALHACTILANQKENYNKNIVTIFPDTGERYLSTSLYNI